MSLKLAEMLPLSSVHAIEPYPLFHSKLEKLATGNKRILVSFYSYLLKVKISRRD